VIGLDTNVLVRYIVQDEPAQARAATRLVESHCTPDDPAVISLIVLCELVWVLSRGYRYGRRPISTVLRQILSADDLHVERAELAWRALNLYTEGKVDFADYLLALCNREERAEITYTFDSRTEGCGLFRLV